MRSTDNRVCLKKAAELLEISEGALRSRLVRGTSPVKLTKVGGRNYFEFAEFEEFEKKGGWASFNSFSREC